MSSSPHQRPFTIFGTKNTKTSHGATDFLRQNPRLAALLPGAMRMGRLQADIAKALPPMFASTGVMSFEGGVLVLGVANAAVAARLKQQVGSLSTALRQRGWDVEQIKMKVQVTQPVAPQHEKRTLALPPTAVDAFDKLGDTLEPTAQNAPLIAALKSLAAKRR